MTNRQPQLQKDYQELKTALQVLIIGNLIFIGFSIMIGDQAIRDLYLTSIVIAGGITYLTYKFKLKKEGNYDIYKDMNNVLFEKEETLVSENFTTDFSEQEKLLLDEIELLQKIIHQLKVEAKEDKYNEYCASLLMTSNFKTILSAYDRVKKGYISDSEALLKKFLEGFMAEIYLYNHPDKAKKWFEGTPLKNIASRKDMMVKLDEINATATIFPVEDYPEFFQTYFYDVGYRNSNDVAHLDFEYVHREIGLDSKGGTAATTFITGPIYDKEYMEIVVNRLLIFTMFQIDYLLFIFEVENKHNYKDVRKRLNEKFFNI